MNNWIRYERWTGVVAASMILHAVFDKRCDQLLHKIDVLIFLPGFVTVLSVEHRATESKLWNANLQEVAIFLIALYMWSRARGARFLMFIVGVWWRMGAGPRARPNFETEAEPAATLWLAGCPVSIFYYFKLASSPKQLNNLDSVDGDRTQWIAIFFLSSGVSISVRAKTQLLLILTLLITWSRGVVN
jgi:hypothetical protein